MKTLLPYIVLLTLAALAGFVIISLDAAPSERRTVGSTAVQAEPAVRAAPAVSLVNESAPTANASTEQDVSHISADATITHPTASAISSTTQKSDIPQSVHVVRVLVSGLKERSSSLLVAVFESATGFPKAESSSSTTVIPVETGTASFSLQLRSHHPTAIAVFQDLDNNGKLTKGSFGIPIEPYGFSNNARSLLGPPTFDQATFQITESDASLEIQVR